MTKRIYPVVRRHRKVGDPLYTPTTPIIVPDIIDLTAKASPIFDQGETSSCTANAIVGVVEYLENVQSEQFVNLSRMFVYRNERVMEHDVGKDEGAVIADGVASVCSGGLGICQESLFPFTQANLFAKPSLEAYADAKNHMGLVHRAVAITPDDIQHCLASGFPVILGVAVYESFEADTVMQTGIIPMPNTQTEKCLGGHAVALFGLDKLDGTYLMRNSWGTTVGIPEKPGYFTIPMEYIHDTSLTSDAWMISKES